MSDTSEDPDPAGAPPTPPRRPHPIYNWRSGIGVALAALATAVSVFLVLIEWMVGEGSGYAGLTLLPLFALGVIGVGLVLSGWLRERRRQRLGRQSSFFDTIVVDPWSIVRGRGSWFLPTVVVAGTFGLLGMGAGSVGLVGYSGSNEFCTQACHSVMGPEGSAYHQAPHSRVDCVACHVHAGPEGFIAAKLGGVRQLYHFVSGDVTRPIRTPLHDGAITRETCEGCHAPERDVGIKAHERNYYLAGEDVDPVRLGMVVKVGGGENGILPGEGVHYHMQIARKVEYVARDAKRQDIAWVRVTDQDGRTREFELDSDPLPAEERASLPVHTMDCIDCHSRAAHRFPSPVESVNRAIDGRLLPPDLPSIKEASVQALDGDYASTAEAIEGIESQLLEFYDEEYPEILEERPEDVAASIATLRTLYQRSVFPEMKADWRAHADNMGHLESPGCFRCHNDEMLDSEGESVATDCSSCHAIIAQDEAAIATMADFEVGQPFVHPEDGSEFDEFTLCSDCHTGGFELYE